MAKTSDHDDQRDEDEDLEEESLSEAEEDEAEEGVHRRAAGGRRARAHAHDEAHGHGDGHEEEAEEAEDLDDPYWWTPHAVLSALVIAGVLGFFGAFNKVLGFAAAVPENAEQATAVTERSAAPAAPRPPALTGAATRGVEAQMGAKHLLVAYKGGLRAAPSIERSKDEARARAAEAAAKAKDTKNRFEDVVKEYSDDATTSTRGGDLGRFSKSAMVPEFQAAVQKLRIGEVSDVVETPFGFHVIQRTY